MRSYQRKINPRIEEKRCTQTDFLAPKSRVLKLRD